MESITLFIHVQDKPGIVELTAPARATGNDLVKLLKGYGVDIDAESVLFVDDADDPADLNSKEPIRWLKPGSHLHVTRCKKIKVTVNFQDKTIDHHFPPGARVRAVKKWAVEKFRLNPTDAGEHVLQICGTTNQPPLDTPLAKLTDGRTCAVCFDLVPEKRVEG